MKAVSSKWHNEYPQLLWLWFVEILDEEEDEIKYQRLNQDEIELTVNNGTIIIKTDDSEEEEDVFNIQTDRHMN
jgi:hypothetical protein